MVPGNAQTQIDLISLGFFEKIANRVNFAPIRLLGYAEAVVDQYGGYVLYGNMADNFEKFKKDHPGESLKIFFKTYPVFSES